MAVTRGIKTISLEYQGFWREVNTEHIPSRAGIYCIYVGRYIPDSRTVRLRRLVYIGEAENVRDRIRGHELWSTWKRYADTREELIFSSAGILRPERYRAEATLIHRHKPPVNTEYVDSFPYETTTILLTGETRLLDTRFTVYGPTC